MAEKSNKKIKLNRTVSRALEILQLLKDSPCPLTITEISIEMNMPVTSTYDIVHTLQAFGYLDYKAEDSKAYKIGAKAFEIGSSYLVDTNIAQIAHPYVERLMRETQSTAFLVIEDDYQVVYIDKVEASTSVKTSADLGSRKDMYYTGIGKSILAYYPEDKVRMIFNNSNVHAYTKYTITSVEDLLRDLTQVRKRGYAIDNREGNINVFCLAHAIFDHSGSPVGGISVAMMYSFVQEELINRYGLLVARYAKEISSKLGYFGPFDIPAE